MSRVKCRITLKTMEIAGIIIAATGIKWGGTLDIARGKIKPK